MIAIVEDTQTKSPPKDAIGANSEIFWKGGVFPPENSSDRARKFNWRLSNCVWLTARDRVLIESFLCRQIEFGTPFDVMLWDEGK